MLINLVNTVIHWPQFDYLSAGRRDESPVGGAASSGQFSIQAADGFNGFLRRMDEFAFWGQKRVARQGPVEFVIYLMLFEYVFDTLTNVFCREFG